MGQLIERLAGCRYLMLLPFFPCPLRNMAQTLQGNLCRLEFLHARLLPSHSGSQTTALYTHLIWFERRRALSHLPRYATSNSLNR